MMQVAPTPSAVSSTTDEALLLLLIRQFSLMQQQMFDQFQQALATIVQMFSSLHRDQLHLLRQELNRVSELTRELQKLQAEQVRQAPVPKQTEIGSELGAISSSRPSVSPIGETAPSTPPQPLLPNKPAEETPAAATEGLAPPAGDAMQFRIEVHTWLAQRLSTLQQERQSRWQKLLGILTGK